LFGDIGQPIDFKGVGYFQSIEETADLQRIVIVGYGALPWPPGVLEAVRETSSSGDLTIRWKRRSRTFGELVDSSDFVPITDYEENDYRVTFYRNRWSEFPGPVEHADGDDVGLVSDVVGAEELTITEATIRTNELNEYDNNGAGQVPSAVWPETAGMGLDDFVGFRYIYVMVQQKTNVPGVGDYGPGVKTKLYVENEGW
jgi:hypothetical protein